MNQSKKVALSALNFHNAVLLRNFLFIFSHTIRYVGSQFLDQGLNLHPPHWKLSLNHRTARDIPAQFQIRKKTKNKQKKHSRFHFFPLERTYKFEVSQSSHTSLVIYWVISPSLPFLGASVCQLLPHWYIQPGWASLLNFRLEGQQNIALLNMMLQHKDCFESIVLRNCRHRRNPGSRVEVTCL